MDISAYIERHPEFDYEMVQNLNRLCPKCGKGKLFAVPMYLTVCNNKDCNYKYNFWKEGILDG